MFLAFNHCAKANTRFFSAADNHFFKAVKSAAADEQYICRVDLNKVLIGMLRPPWGGTDAIVPSISFSSACCTPSPETSRVIEGLSDLRPILSISSI